jgi:hypothetical protein
MSNGNLFIDQISELTSKEKLVDEHIRLIVGDAEYSDTSLIEDLRRELMMVPEKKLIALLPEE